MKAIVQIPGVSLALLNLLVSVLVIVRLHQPTTPLFWAFKVFASALSPVLILIGLLSIVLGLISGFLLTSIMGACSLLILLIHVVKVTRDPDPSTGFEKAFGSRWKDGIAPQRKVRFLPRRLMLGLPRVPAPLYKQNIPFYQFPNTKRQLLCDLWQPPAGVERSGLAFVYLHGSAWSVLDKDFGTRTFFRHLASQGHVIMDVAYRLFPETDIMGMVHDAKHAIAWIKTNASAYGVNPERIIIGGGSAGGHLSLLAAYTAYDKQFTPADLESVDISVHGTISLYGPPDLKALYYHTAQHLASRPKAGPSQKSKSAGMPSWVQKMMGENYHRLGMDKDVQPGTLAPMFGGHPDELPGPYCQLSPVTHVHSGCPPTLIIQGEHDLITPSKSARLLYSRLKAARVPSVLHFLPQTDHAFDLVLPKLSPSAHSAFYDVERFLALMV